MESEHSLLGDSLKNFRFSKKQQIILLLCNYIQGIHIILFLSLLLIPWTTPTRRTTLALIILYIVPPLLARLTLKIRPLQEDHIALPSRDYFTWWFLLNLQMVFCRFSFLEEFLRLFPGIYSAWLRLWGSRIGQHTYWAASLTILDRSFLDIGDGVVFGAGVRLNPHVIAEDSDGKPELLLAPVKIGDHAFIGGYSLLTAGSEISKDEITKAFLKSPPFCVWRGGKRIKRNNNAS
jgi:hypothetical protein